MTPARCFAMLLMLSPVACRGPKSTPEDSMDSYISAYGSQDIDALLALTPPDQVKKYGVKTLTAFYTDRTHGIQHLSAKIQVTSTGDHTAQASTSQSWTYRVRGKNPEEHEDEYQAYLLTEIGGKWYVGIPDDAKVQPF
jgi:hypothetical protein